MSKPTRGQRRASAERASRALPAAADPRTSPAPIVPLPETTDLLDVEDELDELVLDDALSIRRFARARKKRATTGDQLYRLYLVVLLTLPFAYLLVGALQDTVRAPGPQIESLLDRTAIVVPLLLLGLGICALRLSAWTGPVVVARADIAWLFSLPIPRHRLIRPRLVRALVVAAVICGLLGALATVPYHVTVGLAPDAVAEAGRMAVAGAVGGALYGLALAGAGWLVETRQHLARAVMRFSGIALVLVTVGVIVAVLVPNPATWVGTVVLLSGPWGWVTATALAGTSPAAVNLLAGGGAMLALAALAGVLAQTATARAGDVPLEELRRRAATSAQVTAAAVYVADFRSAAQARDRVVRALVGRSRRRLPRPSRPVLLVPWIGATVLARQPRRVGQALLWLLAATWLVSTGLDALVTPGSRGVVVVLIPLGSAVAYAAAGTLVEPLRIEVEQRFGIRMLRQPLDMMGLWHLAVPALVLWLLGIAAAATMVAIQLVPTLVLVLAPAAWLLLAPGLVLVAGFVASGPPADSGWLYTGEAGLGRLAMHQLRGPLLAAALVATPIMIVGQAVAGDGDNGAVVQAVLSGTIFTVGLGVALGRWIQSRLLTNHA